MKQFLPLLLCSLTYLSGTAQDPLSVKPTADFPLDGSGTHPAWEQATWVALNQIDAGVEGYDSKFKILYSEKGIYVLFSGIDKKVTSTYFNDFDDMYKADVFEVFFHPEPQTPLYFEYEINAYDRELVLMIPNLDGKIMGWRPWHYDGERKVQHRVRINEDASGMHSWTAECFFPYALLAPLQKVPAAKGMVWNANFCRLDYDPGKMIKWSWSPVQKSFHEFRVYRQIKFD